MNNNVISVSGLSLFCALTFTGMNFRHTLYPAYKSNRPPTPDTIVQGLQYLKASIKAMSVKVIEVNHTHECHISFYCDDYSPMGRNSMKTGARCRS